MSDCEPSWQFWLNWGAQFFIAFGTVGAVLIALFGDWFRDRFFPPKLRIKLIDPKGTYTPTTINDPANGDERTTVGRWYHLQVENERRWAPAKQVQVFLTRLEIPNAAGKYEIKWIGNFPLAWRYQAINSLSPIVGHAHECDLCSVVKDKWMRLETLITATVPSTLYRDKCNIICTVQARGINADSNSLRIKIVWNGQWSEDSSEMANNMVVQVIDDFINPVDGA